MCTVIPDHCLTLYQPLMANIRIIMDVLMLEVIYVRQYMVSASLGWGCYLKG